MKETSGEVEYAQDRPLTKGEKTVFAITAGLMAIVFVMMLYVVLESMLRSDERQAEIDAEIAIEAAQREADWQNTLQSRATGLMSEIVYVQDSRTGICFAAHSAYRLGHLATVDCAQIPATLLITTETQ